MRVFFFTSWGENGPGEPERHILAALTEAAVRGGFADDLAAFRPLEALAEIPDDAVAWILTEPSAHGAVREALSARPHVGALVTPRAAFWTRPAENLPVIKTSPDEPIASAARASGPGGGDRPPFLQESTDWLAVFWSILQRAEEYESSSPRDTHGRFPSWGSELARRDWLERPIADEIALRLRRLLEAAGWTAAAEAAHSSDAAPGWTLVVTHDVDSLRYWSWRRFGGSVLHALGDPVGETPKGRSRDNSPLQWRTRARRAAEALPGAAPTFRSMWLPRLDPHWTFRWLRRWELDRGVRPTVFVLPEKRTSMEPYDLRRADNPQSSEAGLAGHLTRWVEEGAEIGLHPPYDATEHPERLGAQRMRLEETIAGSLVQSARFHWLRVHPPASWHALARGGLRIDSSMGYSERIGFRAGTCRPFETVDLRTGQPAGVEEIPFAVMDASLRHHMELSPEQALERTRAIAERCRAVGGAFVFLWHTNSFGDREWNRWQNVFTSVVEGCLERGAQPTTLAELAARHRHARRKVAQRLTADWPR